MWVVIHKESGDTVAGPYEHLRDVLTMRDQLNYGNYENGWTDSGEYDSNYAILELDKD